MSSTKLVSIEPPPPSPPEKQRAKSNKNERHRNHKARWFFWFPLLTLFMSFAWINFFSLRTQSENSRHLLLSLSIFNVVIYGILLAGAWTFRSVFFVLHILRYVETGYIFIRKCKSLELFVVIRFAGWIFSDRPSIRIHLWNDWQTHVEEPLSSHIIWTTWNWVILRRSEQRLWSRMLAWHKRLWTEFDLQWLFS